MTPVLLNGPAIEPVSLAEAKVWLRVDTADEDLLLGTLVAAARLIVEAESGRRLISQNWRLILDAWPADGVLRLPLSPVAAVTAVRVYDAAGGASVIDPALYAADLRSEPARLAALADLPLSGRAIAGIEVDLTAGYGATAADVPAPLRQAMLLLIARWYEARGDLSLRIDAGLPPEVRPLVQPYRLRRLA